MDAAAQKIKYDIVDSVVRCVDKSAIVFPQNVNNLRDGQEYNIDYDSSVRITYGKKQEKYWFCAKSRNTECRFDLSEKSGKQVTIKRYDKVMCNKARLIGVYVIGWRTIYDIMIELSELHVGDRSEVEIVNRFAFVDQIALSITELEAEVHNRIKQEQSERQGESIRRFLKAKCHIDIKCFDLNLLFSLIVLLGLLIFITYNQDE